MRGKMVTPYRLLGSATIITAMTIFRETHFPWISDLVFADRLSLFSWNVKRWKLYIAQTKIGQTNMAMHEVYKYGLYPFLFKPNGEKQTDLPKPMDELASRHKAFHPQWTHQLLFFGDFSKKRLNKMRCFEIEKDRVTSLELFGFLLHYERPNRPFFDDATRTAAFSFLAHRNMLYGQELETRAKRQFFRAQLIEAGSIGTLLGCGIFFLASGQWYMAVPLVGAISLRHMVQFPDRSLMRHVLLTGFPQKPNTKPTSVS